MIYTIGHKESYERYFEEQGTPRKLGRTNNHSGGSVWKTKEEAQKACDINIGFAVYGVIADWDKDTVPTLDPWNELLITSELCKI